ncbi:MAG: Signal peptide peptidase SppA, type, partial [Alphaproteobacteria bacterium]|nr:Signal peptide peptidase SppA, type [Alphaproteobacteria bacterium]
MGRFLSVLLAVIGGLTVLLIVVAVAASLWFSPSAPTPPDRIVLKLDLRVPPVEAESSSALEALLADPKPILADIVTALMQARLDRKVAGLILVTGDQSPGLASVQELREALAAFRAADKFVVSFAHAFGEGDNGTGSYYLASAGEIWLQPSGDLALVGIAVETPFLKGALDKLGVEVQGGQRQEFKGAPYSATQTDYIAPHRQNMQGVVDSLFGQIVGDIAKARNIPADELRRLIDRAPLSAADAKLANLVDRIGYWDEVETSVLQQAGARAGLFAIEDYMQVMKKPFASGPVVALISGSGAIVPGENAYSLASGSGLLGADAVTAALREAAEDPAIRAVVLRIDSPGGSYVASDTVFREVARTRSRGKPVIVSMGDTAASGGYFIALPADLIVASRATITGSIGVFSYKPVLDKALADIGVNVSPITAGANSNMNSLFRRFTPEQAAAVERSLDRVYADFTKRVADARKLSPQQVDQVARGRIWTGQDAKRVGLVD